MTSIGGNTTSENTMDATTQNTANVTLSNRTRNFLREDALQQTPETATAPIPTGHSRCFLTSIADFRLRPRTPATRLGWLAAAIRGI